LIENKPLGAATNLPGHESPGPESARAQFAQAQRGFSALGTDCPAWVRADPCECSIAQIGE